MSKTSPPDLSQSFSPSRKPRISKISYKEKRLVSKAFRPSLSVLKLWHAGTISGNCAKCVQEPPCSLPEDLDWWSPTGQLQAGLYLQHTVSKTSAISFSVNHFGLVWHNQGFAMVTHRVLLLICGCQHGAMILNGRSKGIFIFDLKVACLSSTLVSIEILSTFSPPLYDLYNEIAASNGLHKYYW